MRSSIIAASFLAALAPQALANLYITSPVASTSCAAGQQCNVAWNDDGTTPALGTIGACDVALYVGSVTTQIKLQDLGSVQVAQQASASFIPDPSVGANSNLYFLRFTAINYQPDPSTGIPYEGFTAKFTLTGMTGSFNETVQSLMTAGSTAAGGSSTVGSSTPAGSATITSATGITTTTKAASGTSSPTSSAHSSTTSGAASASFGVSSPAAALSVVLSAFFAAVAF